MNLNSEVPNAGTYKIHATSVAGVRVVEECNGSDFKCLGTRRFHVTKERFRRGRKVLRQSATAAIFLAVGSNFVFGQWPADLSDDVIYESRMGHETVAGGVRAAVENASHTLFVDRFQLVDIEAPVQGLPAAYMLTGRAIDDSTGSSVFLPAGTEFRFDWPAGSRFLEVSAMDADTFRTRQFDCSVNQDSAQCVVPDGFSFLFRVVLGLIHDVEGPGSISLEVIPASGDAGGDTGAASENFITVSETDEPAVLGIGFLYTEDMQYRLPGSRLRSQFESWIAFSNRILRESGVKLLLRYAGSEAFPVPDSMDLSQARNHVASSSEYSAFREQVLADAVVLYTDPRPGLCGLAPLNLAGNYITSDGQALFAVNDAAACPPPGDIFLHELGHVLGLGHFAEAENVPRGYWEFSRGWRQDAPESNARLGTIMAGNRTNRMANPEVICPHGFPCGRSIEDPVPADAALTMNGLRHAAAAAKTSVVPAGTPDTGIFLRGLRTTATHTTVRVELQNYADSQLAEVPFLIEAPDGWTLWQSTPGGVCTTTTNGAECNPGTLPAFEGTHVDIEFDRNGLTGERIVSRLIQPDGMEENNRSEYDSRAFHMATSGYRAVDDPDRLGVFTFNVRRDLHDQSTATVSIMPAPGQQLQNVRIIHSPTFNFGTGFTNWPDENCSDFAPTSVCPELPTKPVYDLDYAEPANKQTFVVWFDHISGSIKPPTLLLATPVERLRSELVFRDGFGD